MIQRNYVQHTEQVSEQARKHTVQLVRLLASRVDSVSRSDIYQRDAERCDKILHCKILAQMQERDRAHAEWLAEEIVRGLGI